MHYLIDSWRRDRGGTWHVRWGLLTLVTILKSLSTLCLVKVKTKYQRSVMWLCGCISLILSRHPAKFGVHKTYRSNGYCSITSNSNSSSNSNTEVPMPRFTNEHRLGRSWIVLIQQNHFFCSTTCLEKIEIINCQKSLIVCALPETEYHVNSFQVDLPSLHHLKTSCFSYF